MQGGGPARKVKGRSSPLVVVAGEFSTGKSSLINLLLKQRVLQPSVGLQTQLPTRLRHGSQTIVTACRRDGAVQQFSGIEQATATSDVTEIELYLPFDLFPGVEIQELPPPDCGDYPVDWRQTAGSADILLLCTIGSQPWRLSEKDCISKLGRSPNQTTILCVMRDDLIRSDSDRGKINRRLQTEARPFFTDIVFIDASTKSLRASMKDDQAWKKSGAGVIGSAISRLPGANVTPPPQTFDAAETIHKSEPEASSDMVQNVVCLPERQWAIDPIKDALPINAEPEENLDQLMSEALDILLGAVGKLDGCRYAAIVVDAAYIRERGNAANLTSVAAARALFFAQTRNAAVTGPVEEVIIRAKHETHLLSAIDGASHVHLVLEPSVATLASVRSVLRTLKESASASA